MTGRLFPIQNDYALLIWGNQRVAGPRAVPWERAQEAYVAYAALHGTQQSLERLAERGGFGWFEFLALHRVYRMMEACRASGRRLTHRQIYELMDYAAWWIRD
jgi:hypothetical protein